MRDESEDTFFSIESFLILVERQDMGWLLQNMETLCLQA